MGSDTREGWSRITLGEAGDIVGGGTPSTKDPGNFGGDIPWITPRDLAAYPRRGIRRGQRNLTSKGLDSSSARWLPPRSVLISSRAPIGYCAVAETAVTTNQGFRSLILSGDHHPEFFYYLIKASRPLLESRASGSTFKEISGTTLKETEVLVPTLPEQRRIAWVLGALDDQLEVNRRIAETLEQIAAAISRARFVDFVGVQELEESELGPIPRGWSVVELADLVQERRETVSGNREEPYIGLDAMPRGSTILADWQTANAPGGQARVFRRDDILFGKLRPYFKKVGPAPTLLNRDRRA